MPKAFRWNPGAGRYRAPNGRFVSFDRIHEALEERMAGSAERMGIAYGRLESGTLTVSEWRDVMAHEIRKLHVSATALANGGWAQTPSWDWTGERVRRELQYLDRFAAQLASGEQAMDGRAVVRASMYANAGHATHEAGRVEQQRKAGKGEYSNVLTAVENCVGCIAQTARGWVPVGSLVPIGDRLCLTNCRCFYAFRGDQPKNVLKVQTAQDARGKLAAIDSRLDDLSAQWLEVVQEAQAQDREWTAGQYYDKKGSPEVLDWERRVEITDQKKRRLREDFDSAEAYEREQTSSALDVPIPATIKLKELDTYTDQQRKAMDDMLPRLARRTKHPSLDSVEISVGTDSSPSGRSNAAWWDRRVQLSPEVKPERVAHEFGHLLEADPKVLKKAVAFRDKRRGTEAYSKLSELTGHASYTDDELSFADSWGKEWIYAGKYYDPDKLWGNDATEVISEGVARYMTDPRKFAREDPEWFDLIYSVMRGID